MEKQIDRNFMRSLWAARLAEYNGPLTPMALAEFNVMVAAEIGLLAADPHAEPATPTGHATLAVRVVAEALRVNAPTNHSYEVLATCALDALIAKGFSLAAPLPGRVALSPMQLRTLELAADGNSYEEIAKILGIQRATVSTHLDKARAAFGARNTLHAVVTAVRMGLVGRLSETLAAA